MTMSSSTNPPEDIGANGMYLALGMALAIYGSFLTNGLRIELDRARELGQYRLVRKLALALHTSLRFAEANDTYQRAFEHWKEPDASPGASATLRMAASYVPQNNDPASAGWW